jgi:hypothetical protein
MDDVAQHATVQLSEVPKTATYAWVSGQIPVMSSIAHRRSRTCMRASTGMPLVGDAQSTSCVVRRRATVALL